MSKSLKIIQLSDTHIFVDNSKDSEESRIRSNFKRVLKAIEEKNIDLIVLTGDLAKNNGEIESYYWLKEQLESIALPYIITPGNHDVIDNLNNVFQLDSFLLNSKVCFRERIEEQSLYFLDSSTYIVDDFQLDWLQDECLKEDRNVILFMHHPPVRGGCTFMDKKYPLKNMTEVWEVIRSVPQITNIFCGHYHTDKTLLVDDKLVHFSPSTQYQISRDDPGYKIIDYRPGYRLIELSGKKVDTEVIYLED